MKEFWRRWLIVAAGITAASGVAFAVLGAFGLVGVLNSVLDVLYFPGELAEPAREAALFAIGVMGALMAGWAAMMLVLLSDPITSSRATVWWALTIGLLTWFVIDGIVTVAIGATGNLVLNVVFVGLYAPALVATRPGPRQSEH